MKNINDTCTKAQGAEVSAKSTTKDEFMELLSEAVSLLNKTKYNNPKKKTFKEELEESWAEEENYINSLPEEEAIAYCNAKVKETLRKRVYLNKLRKEE